jgi:alcohol dehydrogenase class IV
MHSPFPSFENHLPRRVITGRGASQSLAALCQTNGWNRVFVVSDAGVAGAGLLRQVALPLRAETFAEVLNGRPKIANDKGSYHSRLKALVDGNSKS